MADGPAIDVDVAVLGAGPAGRALGAACAANGLRTVVIGPDDPWTATYGTWRDDVAELPDEVFAATSPRAVVHGDRRHVLERAYSIFDNAALRRHLDAAGAERVLGTGTIATDTTPRAGIVETSAGPVVARIVVDATGAGRATGRPRAWQSAFGVVLDHLPASCGADSDAVTLMDLRPVPGVDDLGTFLYVVPVDGGWLLEETMLASATPVAPDVLRRRLVARLGRDGEELVRAAPVPEVVRIPMGAPLPSPTSRPLPFGAAAGYVHPATGYSVAASLRAAPRVAAAIARVDDVRRDAVDRALWAAVWPSPARRARALHDYGLRALVRLDPPDLRRFFDAFFELPTELWRDYLRIDTTAGRVGTAMARVFAASPWRVRRTLVRL